MSKCTAAQALEAFSYWLGYCEKATTKYAGRRDKAAFELDKGSNNYTYPGYLCGIQGGAWCAMMVSTAIYEACGNSKADAKAIMRVWPYANCGQMWDAAPSSMRGKRGSWTPKPGDIIIFSDNGTVRSHTGMVYAVDGTYVYTYEGNSANMCRKRSYVLTSTYIYGYVRPDYADGDAPVIHPEQYGKAVYTIGKRSLHELSKGCAGAEVKTVQRLCYSRGYKGADGKPITADGDFGRNTEAAVKAMQAELGLTADGVVGADTWPEMLTQLW